MQFYSWKDIERYCRMNRQLWSADFDDIEVYPSEVIVYKKEPMERSVSQALRDLFDGHYDNQSTQILLDIGSVGIPVYEQVCQERGHKLMLPLFRDVLYQTTSYPSKALPALPKPVLAFHSYKGGVGRTLSLIAFAKAWSAAFEETEQARLLVVDSDIEAPGLTWLQEDRLGEDSLSYLDLLTLIQDNTDVEYIADLACAKLKTTTLPIETKNRTIEHVFIPVYRYEEQLLDLYATPESIVNGRDKEYVLAEVISRICERLGIGAALVDLRAGISEFSSTLLLDPRVKKYLVTSTSTQSVKGTQILLKYLLKGLLIQEDTALPEVFLNMIPDSLSEGEVNDVLGGLLQFYESQQEDESSGRTDNVVTELPFASELIHLTSMKQILNNLNGRDMFLILQTLVSQNYSAETPPKEHSVGTEGRTETLKRIHELADAQLAAEANSKFEVLMTEPLKNLSRKYSDVIPTTVIMGAKGAGKTFLYRKMLELLDWSSFCSSLNGPAGNVQDSFFLPVIATKNNINMIDTLKKCIQNLNEQIPCAAVPDDIFLENGQRLDRQKTQPTEWLSFWQELLAGSICSDWTTLAQADKMLAQCGKKIIFLVDGLEEVFQQVAKNEEEGKAVRILCQDVVNQLVTKHRNLGIIVFLRRDMAQASIPVNFKQFEQVYKQTELKWSSNEALRLAVWLVAQAVETFYEGPEGIDSVSQDVIGDNLTRLWGLKLGKPSSNEAYSSRWILAALSDLNGQLQARDIIRFLKYATAPSNKRSSYPDRILMPTEIREAVSTCSSEKMDEVKQEYAALRPIFEKLEQLPAEEKLLPLDPGHAQLNNDEEKRMILEGYLKRDGDKYYLPEIIRHALGFKYGKGARPKVIFLTLKH